MIDQGCHCLHYQELDLSEWVNGLTNDMWITSVGRLAWGASTDRAAGVASMEADLAYFQRRMAEEQAAASAAGHPQVRRVHRELAAAYGARLTELDAPDRPLALHLVSAA